MLGGCQYVVGGDYVMGVGMAVLGEGEGGGAYRSICPSFISCAFISDLKSGSGALAAAAFRGITTPVGVLPGDGCDIVCKS